MTDREEVSYSISIDIPGISDHPLRTGTVEIEGFRTKLMAGEIRTGDTITIDAAPDHRSWWRRTMPRWLGGKQAPKPFEGIVTVVSGTTTSLS